LPKTLESLYLSIYIYKESIYIYRASEIGRVQDAGEDPDHLDATERGAEASTTTLPLRTVGIHDVAVRGAEDKTCRRGHER
jgi:hypothetical protein